MNNRHDRDLENNWPHSVNNRHHSVNNWPDSVNNRHDSVKNWLGSVNNWPDSVKNWHDSVKNWLGSVNSWPHSFNWLWECWVDDIRYGPNWTVSGIESVHPNISLYSGIAVQLSVKKQRSNWEGPGSIPWNLSSGRAVFRKYGWIKEKVGVDYPPSKDEQFLGYTGELKKRLG